MANGIYSPGQLNGARQMTPPASESEKQSRRLLIALSLLVVALIAVIVKNRDFWFGSDDSGDSEIAISEPATKSATTSRQAMQSIPAAKVPVAQNAHAKNSGKLPEPKATPSAAEASTAPLVASNRVVLPPLDVEVVAGDKHSTIHPGSSAMVADIPADSNRGTLSAAASLATNAAQNEPIAVAPELPQAIHSTYPVLSEHSRVQGSVVMEAVIRADGSVEALRILSGPSILTTAAQQAVYQWRFKPYLQNGHPVETKCRVTVNFSIRVSDNPPSAS